MSDKITLLTILAIAFSVNAASMESKESNSNKAEQAAQKEKKNKKYVFKGQAFSFAANKNAIISATRLGKIYAAHCIEDESNIAIKWVGINFEPYSGENPFVELRLLKELRDSNAPGGKHIIQLVDYGYNKNGCIWMAFPLANLGDCFTCINNKIISTSDARPLAHQIAKAVNHLHLNNITHGDISLENCLLFGEPNGNIVLVLTDLGAAQKVEDGVLSEYKGVGKDSYLPPEVYKGQKPVFCARSADIWTFGICCFILAAHHPLFEQACESDQRYLYFSKHSLKETIAALGVQGLDDLLVDLLSQTIVDNPEARLNSSQVLEHIFFQQENL